MEMNVISLLVKYSVRNGLPSDPCGNVHNSDVSSSREMTIYLMTLPFFVF